MNRNSLIEELKDYGLNPIRKSEKAFFVTIIYIFSKTRDPYPPVKNMGGYGSRVTKKFFLN